MLDRPPKEPELLSWIYVILWSGVTLATIPFARLAVDYVDGQWGDQVFTYGVAAAAVLVAAFAIHMTRRRGSWTSPLVLAGLAGLVVYLTFALADSSPEEAVHYLQYGFLSLLIYRAFAHRIRDYSIYVAATVLGMIVGMVDETIQWLTPERYFGMRDVWLNATAVALVQVGLAVGVRPRFVSRWPNRASLRRVLMLAAVAVTYLGLIHINTPDRIARYAKYVGFVAANQQPMAEYGYLHGREPHLRFRSRLTAEELRNSARERAEEASEVLDDYRDRGRYYEFLDIYTPATDPFLHEARVHLFRRDTYLDRARRAESTEAQRQAFAVAYWENRILENYFGELIRSSSYRWPRDLELEVQNKAPTDHAYESPVSRNLIVSFTEQQLAIALFSAAGILWFFALYIGIRTSAEMQGHSARESVDRVEPVEHQTGKVQDE